MDKRVFTSKRISTRICESCNQEFIALNYVIAKGGARFCSWACSHKSRPNMKKHKDHIKGYRSDTIDGKRIREHRLIAARKVGRPLTSSEVVHHINGIKSDNRPENLMVLSGHSEHKHLHFPPLTTWSKKYPCCQGCGRTSVPHSARGLCDACIKRQIRGVDLARPMGKPRRHR